jgi:predicted AlkP superfamily phosphohydrolase/phosphomutase
MGPGIKHNLRLMGFEASVYDIAPTILHLYGIEQPSKCVDASWNSCLSLQTVRSPPRQNER